MSQKTYDFVVIGSGPAGKSAAVLAAKLGKSVLMIEKNPVIGGVSVHSGTIPSKTLRETVLYLTGWRQRGFYGLSYKVKQDITAEDLHQRLEQTLSHEVDVLQHQLNRNNVKVVNGLASFVDANSISVSLQDGSQEVFHGEKFLICVGTRPHRPGHVPFDGETILDSDDILKLQRIPKSLLVVGAGVIGIEYATIYNALDTDVTIVDAKPRFLEFVDDEIIEDFTHLLRDSAVTLRLNEELDTIEKRDDGRVITRLKSGKSIIADTVLFAAGRQGMTDDLQLDKAGLEADGRGRIKVNDQYQTEQPHIYAAGDVIGFPSLASTSMEQGRVAACHAFQLDCPNQSHLFPYGIYSVPEISMVGLTEQECQRKGIAYEVGVARFREIARGQIMGLNEGKLKMLFSLEDRRLLGVHIVGEGATELVHIGQAVISLGGSLDYFLQSVFNYPTLAEAYKVAALDAWNRLTI